MAETGDGPHHHADRPPEGADPAGRRYALTVAADEIRPGDWLRDQGELRQVERVESVHERLPARSDGAGPPGPTAFIVRFAVREDEAPSHLFIPAEVLVSVWRPHAAP
jgi:hypothetical protein